MNMTEEYASVLSYYIYVGVLNNWITIHDVRSDSFKGVSLCLAYPLIQQIYSAIGPNNQVISKEEAANLFSKLESIKASIVRNLFKSQRHSLIEILCIEEHRRRRENQEGSNQVAFSQTGLEKLFSGAIFQTYSEEVGNYIEPFIRSIECPATAKIIEKLKNLYLFKPDFAHESSEATMAGNHSENSELLKGAYKLREHWEGLKRTFMKDIKINSIQENEKIVTIILDEASKCKPFFQFMNVGENDLEQLTKFIYPTMIYMFLYLQALKGVINPNDNGSRMYTLRITLNFIWKLFLLARQSNYFISKFGTEDPTKFLDLTDKTKKIEFLNRYTGIVYNLRIKKSNIYILKDLLRFAIKFIFYRSEGRINDKKFDEVLNGLKLDSFMELYDYLEELDNSKEVSENYKENIVNMFVQFVKDVRFKKHILDIQNIVKVIQGDLTKVNYFIDRVFTKSEKVVVR